MRYVSRCLTASYAVLQASKPHIQKIGTVLGLTAAFGVGILAGIESAILWSKQKLLVALLFGGASCFINSLSYYYVVMRKENSSRGLYVTYQNNWKSNLFAVCAVFFGGIMFVSNFNGMYVSFTVLGDKLNQLGEKGQNIPAWLLETLGILFGSASAISGAIFNITVGSKLCNGLRTLISESDEQPLLANVDTVDLLRQPPNFQAAPIQRIGIFRRLPREANERKSALRRSNSDSCLYLAHNF